MGGCTLGLDRPQPNLPQPPYMTHISTQAKLTAAINDNGCLLSMLLPSSTTFPRRYSLRIRRVQFLEWILILFRKHNIEPGAPMKPFTIKYLTKTPLVGARSLPEDKDHGLEATLRITMGTGFCLPSRLLLLLLDWLKLRTGGERR